MSQTAKVNQRVGTVPMPTRAWRLEGALRPVLMAGGVAAMLIGAGAWWLSAGRIVSIDNAYLRAAKLSLTTDVSGVVAQVSVHEGQAVRRGEVLLRLDDRPFRIALEGAQAALAQSRLDVEALKRDYQRSLREVEAGAAQVAADEASYRRFAGLVGSGAVTKAETDDARFKLQAERQMADGRRIQSQVDLAKLGGNPDIRAAETPAVRAAQARVDEAQRQLDDSVLRAPFDGIVTRVEQIQPGAYLGAATPAFALVSTRDIWAEGNPKETELTWVTPGDKVSITADTYPGRSWTGVVDSISPASGAEFSVLPAQNSSGNWVKVVQRIPLRVRIDPAPDAPALRAGMSLTLDIDTGHVRHLSDLMP